MSKYQLIYLLVEISTSKNIPLSLNMKQFTSLSENLNLDICSHWVPLGIELWRWTTSLIGPCVDYGGRIKFTTAILGEMWMCAAKQNLQKLLVKVANIVIGDSFQGTNSDLIQYIIVFLWQSKFLHLSANTLPTMILSINGI